MHIRQICSIPLNLHCDRQFSFYTKINSIPFCSALFVSIYYFLMILIYLTKQSKKKILYTFVRVVIFFQFFSVLVEIVEGLHLLVVLYFIYCRSISASTCIIYDTVLTNYVNQSVFFYVRYNPILLKFSFVLCMLYNDIRLVSVQ